jgi:hypothetical protein
VAGGQCRDEQGQTVPCCAWQADSWVPAYMSFASVTMLWTVFLFGQFRIFTISGTIAQWCLPGLLSFFPTAPSKIHDHHEGRGKRPITTSADSSPFKMHGFC